MKKYLFVFLFAGITHEALLGQRCAQPFHVVVIGSSTSVGANATPYTNGYVYLFKNYLTTNVNAGCTVTNLSEGGRTTYSMQPNWYKPPSKYKVDSTKNIDAALALRPDVLLINFPSNDARDGIAIAEQKQNFLRVAAKADSAHIPVWFTSTQPRNLTDTARRNTLIVMKDWLKKTFGSKYIDFWTGIANNDGTIVASYNSGDGTHMNNAGHVLLMEKVKNSGIIEAACKSVQAGGTGSIWRTAENNDQVILGRKDILCDIQLCRKGNKERIFAKNQPYGVYAFPRYLYSKINIIIRKNNHR